MQQTKDMSDLWTKFQRQHNKTTPSWPCILCPDKKMFKTTQELWSHANSEHSDQIPRDDEALKSFRKTFESESTQKRPKPAEKTQRKPDLNEDHRAQPEPGGSTKRPLSISGPPTRSLSGLSVTAMARYEDESRDIPARKRAAIGDGISAGSASPFRASLASPPPRRSKARPTSAPFGSSSDQDVRKSDTFDTRRPRPGNKQLWREPDSPTARPSFVDPKNIASIQAQKQRAQALQPKSRKSFQAIQDNKNSTSPIAITPKPAILRNLATNTPAPSVAPSVLALPKEEAYDIILQPETRPISQEQLVAEVKGIYAGLVMVEAKCIEVDDKKAIPGQAYPSGQPKLNNEQWQALIALHRTLLHEHHDFFLASQHPSASPALRRLASKYAMPARMWRHGIHSFLELLRHRLPLSLDHMLAFIYLAYSMMALLYETVPAFEDTWIECLGDLGCYRMAIDDNYVRDKETWTRAAGLWYSKMPDRAPTTGRFYHYLAILAPPNALQQLYYSRLLCVVVPFASVYGSILTLFEPVLNTVAILNLGSGVNVSKVDTSSMIGNTPTQGADDNSDEMFFFKYAQRQSNATLNIVLQRIGDPNVLPFIHVILVFVKNMLQHSGITSLYAVGFPWKRLVVMLNIPVASFRSPTMLALEKFPKPEKDGNPPFPGYSAIDGLLLTENPFPDLKNEKSDEEEKCHERALMRAHPKERIVCLEITQVEAITIQNLCATDSTRQSILSWESFSSVAIRLLISSLISRSKSARGIWELWLAPLVLMSQFSCAEAAPVAASKTEIFVAHWQEIWTAFIENFLGPVIVTFVESCALLLLYKTIVWHDSRHQQPTTETDLEGNLDEPKQVRRRKSQSLLYSQVILPFGVFILGRDDRVQPYILVPLWLFALALSVKYLQQKLLPYSTSAGQTFIFITTLAAGSAGWFTHQSASIEGRYSDQLTYTMFTFLPAFSYFGASWVAIVLMSGRAKIIEERFRTDSRPSDEKYKMKFEPASENTDSNISTLGIRPRNRKRAKSQKFIAHHNDRRPTLPISIKHSVTKVKKTEPHDDSPITTDVSSGTASGEATFTPGQSFVADLACNIAANFIAQ